MLRSMSLRANLHICSSGTLEEGTELGCIQRGRHDDQLEIRAVLLHTGVKARLRPFGQHNHINRDP